MYFLEMIKLIQEKYEVSLCSNIDNSTIMDIALLSDSPVFWSQHTLYIGDLSESNHLPNQTIMILATDSVPVEDILPPGSSCGIIDSNDIENIYQLASDILYEDLKSEAILFKITQAALEGKSIVNLINTAASLIGNALILVDSNMKVLVHSTVIEIKDPLWAENIKIGHYSYEFMQKVRLNLEMQEWSKGGEESKIITLKGDVQPKLVARITRSGHVVGGLVMIAHHTSIHPYHVKQLHRIGRILFDTFDSELGNSTHKSFYSAILFHLLSGDEPAETFELLTMSNSDFPDEMTVIVARFINRVENRYLKKTIRLKLEKIFPEGYSVQFKGYIAILVSSISTRQRDELSQLVILENINIGISWSFSDILDFRKYFAQAVSSIKQAQSFGLINKVLNYTDYSFYNLLYHYNGKLPLQNYCHPSLQILRDYDKSNNTELYITLKAFLNSNRNLGITAEILFLHRNSVTYRINRIVEITGINLNDINTIYALVDSFRINDFLDSIDILNS